MLALILLILVFPLLILVAFAILVTTFESPLFIQERLGKNLSAFKIIKLRSMKNGKVTMIGKIIRRTGIDELPQLFNIIKSEMAFVGPRPLTREDVDRLGWNSEDYTIRWSVKPGITGLAQLLNVCDKNVSWNADLTYIQTKSAKKDVSILIRSALVPLLGKSTIKNIIHSS